jgi:hypothetical protein
MSAPERPSTVAVLVLACASGHYGRLIETIRRTWASRRVEGIDVWYVYGKPEAGEPTERLERWLDGEVPEVEPGGLRQIGDILLAGAADAIREQEDCLLWKRLLAFGHLCELGYDRIYTVCAASYVDLEQLRRHVDTLPSTLAVSGGVSIEPTQTAPFVSGDSMMLTADVARELARDRDEIVAQNAFGFRDDVTLGQWVAKHLSAVPIEQFIDDVVYGRPLTREHVFIRTQETSRGFVNTPIVEQRPAAGAHHYHFHSRKAHHMERFHAAFFGDRRPGEERPDGIRYVQIFGERCSGTSYLTRLVERNFDGVEPTRLFGFKHWFIHGHQPRGRANRTTDFECLHPLDDSDDTLFLVIHRNPLDWLRSLHARPHHAPGHTNLCFSEFLRKPWLSAENGRANPLWPDAEGKGYFIEEAEDVLHLRSQKIRHFLALEDVVSNVVFLRYEDLLEDLGVLETVADRFGIPLRHRPLENETVHLGSGDQRTFDGPRRYPPITPEDLGFIRRNLDWDLESRLGYEWDDLRRKLDEERALEAAGAP